MTKGKVEEPAPSHYHLSLEVGEHSVSLPSSSGLVVVVLLLSHV